MRKHLILAVVIAATMPAAMADSFQAMARVLTVAPYMQTISVPQQVCTTSSAPPTTGGVPGVGSVIGGIAGALLGSQVGQGNGRIAAAAVGAATGALAGQSMQQDAPQQPVQSCQTVYRTSQQADGYQVTYTYAGRQFTTVLPYDPGQSVQVTVQVHPAP